MNEISNVLMRLCQKVKKKVNFILETNFKFHFDTSYIGDCWDVRQCFGRQFKTDYVRLIEGLVFEKKKIFFGDR